MNDTLSITATAAVAGSAGADRAYPALRVLFENLESLAIAVVMALVLKFFLIEAYKIPTGSMQPTIMGDENTNDRVLVNKIVYFLRGPERFEVIVFRNPLNQRQNYIKRLVGFGGETLTIRNGDVYVRKDGGEERVLRKPESVWRSVRKRLWPANLERPLSRYLELEGAARLDGDLILLSGTEAGPARLKNAEPVRDGYFDGYHRKLVSDHLGEQNRNDVQDLELKVSVEPAADCRELRVTLAEGPRVHEVRFDLARRTTRMLSGERDPSSRLVGEPSVFETDQITLKAGHATEISFRNLDDELRLQIDGEEIARHAYRCTDVDHGLSTWFWISASGPAEIADLQVYRDIHYLSGGPGASARFLVPEGHLFAMGDNTQNSADSRQWSEATVTWKETVDGSAITRTERGNHFNPGGNHPDSNPRAARGEYRMFRNSFGQLFQLPEKCQIDTRDYHSLPDRMLLGKALAVFWPIPPFSPTWRIKWVR